jgi:CRISPR system Cascade subunit CasB
MTTTTPEPTPVTYRTRDLGPVGTAADRFIRPLQRGYRDDRPAAVSTLARLRRGAGRPANDLPDLWGVIGTDELTEALAALPEDRAGTFDHGRAEEALHLAGTLWALHQQSHRGADMHVGGLGLGRAVRMLMLPGSDKPGRDGESGTDSEGGKRSPADPELNEPLRRRFVRVGTAGSLDVLAQRLREIVLLLRRDAVPLDYGLLADQLFWWQVPVRTAAVRRGWGRDFHLAGTSPGKRS